MPKLLILLWGLVLYGQDAGMVLRTSVGYNTQKATLTLTAEQRKQADQLGQEAQRAAQAGKYGEALRDYYQGLAVMRNVSWTPAYQFAISLGAKLDHAMIAPRSQATVTLAPLFTIEAGKTEAGKTTASARLIPVKKDASAEKTLAAALTVDPASLPFIGKIAMPDSPAGDYNLEIRLANDAEPAAQAAFIKTLPIHIEALSDQARRLRDRLDKIEKRDTAAVPTAEYSLALYDLADRGDINPHRYQFDTEFAAANAMLDSLQAGRDPFAGKRGDSRRAYRSAVDKTLQPYRLLIPASYDGSKPAPLVVALHGMGGDENSMFDSYQEGLLKRESERVGFIVVCPKGRDSASMYRGSAEQDVLDVLAEVRRDYRIDANRIYLMGHSMGGYGTWSVAANHPDLFAALGPISGGGNPADMVKLRNVPQYVVHGDDDRTVAVTQSRAMVEAGRKAGANITYVEIPGGSHVSVAAPQFAPMLDFFASHSKTGAE